MLRYQPGIMRSLTTTLPALGIAVLTACTAYINVNTGETAAGDTTSTSSTSGTTSTSDTSDTTLLCGEQFPTGGAVDTTYPTSCNALKVACPGSVSGEYMIDPDGDGVVAPLMVHCEMEVDDCGYTMVRFDDAALGSKQDVYGEKCAAVGMEVIVPRTRELAMAIYIWNDFVVANLYNVFPKYDGATELLVNWHAICQGEPCTFWMTDNADGNVACRGVGYFEPNGTNIAGGRIYRWNEDCLFQGGWDDHDDLVQYTGWVICSTNDC